MSKLEQYSRDLEFCLANAKRAFSQGMRTIWQAIADSYAFLIELIRPAEGRPKPITLTA